MNLAVKGYVHVATIIFRLPGEDKLNRIFLEPLLVSHWESLLVLGNLKTKIRSSDGAEVFTRY